MKKTAALFLGMAILWCHAAVAGVVVDVEQREGSGDAITVVKGQLLLDVDRLKMVTADNSGEPSVIYQGDKERLLIVDHSRKSWMQIDAAMMQEVMGQMQGMQEQMQQALAQLPPEQRKAAEEMMQQRMPASMSGGAAKSKAFEVTATGRKKKLQGKPCEAYEVHLDGKLQSIIWATDWKNVSVSSDDFRAFRSMAAFFGDLLESMPMMAEEGGPEMFPGLDEVEGFPMVIQNYEDGVLASETFFRNPRREDIDASEFEPPDGYEMQSMMGQQ